MISLVCVYNSEAVLKYALQRSLEGQTATFQSIMLDNRHARFKSAAQALNCGGRQATGDYIMFVHQDMWLATNTWLEDVESILKTLPALGVAGVAGTTDTGPNHFERLKFSLAGLDDIPEGTGGYVQSPVEVQTLDECLLFVPRTVFERQPFDEETFDGWDCYGADYCLSALKNGLRVYVVPAPSSHCCTRSRHETWEFQGLLKYQRRLHRKHRGAFRRIHTWMGTISYRAMAWRTLHSHVGPIYTRLIPGILTAFKNEINGCQSVLELGCGSNSLFRICDVPYSVGVDMFQPSLLESRRRNIHSEYVMADVVTVAFRPKSFDAVIATEVLEHLTREEGLELLGKAETWARKKVVITTPNGYLKQDPYGDNLLQEHKSGWTVGELQGLGYHVRGCGGWKILRGHLGHPRYKPYLAWGLIARLTQIVAYRCPRTAFQLLAVKRPPPEQPSPTTTQQGDET